MYRTPEYEESRTYNRRIGHGPLRGSPDAIVKGALVRIVPAVRVGQEQGVEVSSLQELGQFDPVLQVAFRGRLVFRVLQIWFTKVSISGLLRFTYLGRVDLIMIHKRKESACACLPSTARVTCAQWWTCQRRSITCASFHSQDHESRSGRDGLPCCRPLFKC